VVVVVVVDVELVDVVLWVEVVVVVDVELVEVVVWVEVVVVMVVVEVGNVVVIVVVIFQPLNWHKRGFMFVELNVEYPSEQI
jgi:hypothetical protein